MIDHQCCIDQIGIVKREQGRKATIRWKSRKRKKFVLVVIRKWSKKKIP